MWLEIIGRSDLAGGMALEGQARLGRGDAAAVVLDAISRRPPSRTSTRISVAPASRLFSISSLTADAGRSTTSPAAIWLATSGERMWIGMGELYHSPPAKHSAGT